MRRERQVRTSSHASVGGSSVSVGGMCAACPRRRPPCKHGLKPVALTGVILSLLRSLCRPAPVAGTSTLGSPPTTLCTPSTCLPFLTHAPHTPPTLLPPSCTHTHTHTEIKHTTNTHSHINSHPPSPSPSPPKAPPPSFLYARMRTHAPTHHRPLRTPPTYPHTWNTSSLCCSKRCSLRDRLRRSQSATVLSADPVATIHSLKGLKARQLTSALCASHSRSTAAAAGCAWQLWGEGGQGACVRAWVVSGWDGAMHSAE